MVAQRIYINLVCIPEWQTLERNTNNTSINGRLAFCFIFLHFEIQSNVLNIDRSLFFFVRLNFTFEEFRFTTKNQKIVWKKNCILRRKLYTFSNDDRELLPLRKSNNSMDKIHVFRTHDIIFRKFLQLHLFVEPRNALSKINFNTYFFYDETFELLEIK